jgi:phosphinothricin acetyltransferase
MPFIVLATSSGEVIGFAYVAPWREKSAFKKTVENSVYLRPGAIGKGHGKALLKELIRLSTESGIKEIIAVISDSGAEASIALHKNLGFEQQGHLGKVGFKFGRWLGTVLLQKSLK